MSKNHAAVETRGPDELHEEALTLAQRTNERFLHLGRCLVQLQQHGPDWLKRFAEQSGMGLRKAYYLVGISRRLEPLGLDEARLQAIGWTKLTVIAAGINKRNAMARLLLAEEHTTRALQASLREEDASKARCVLMYFTPEDYEAFEQAVLENGGRRSGRGLTQMEAAIMRIIRRDAVAKPET